MKKVLFFIENAWAFGTIHQALSKVLYQHGILADVLDWGSGYPQADMDLINQNYDYYVTLPEAVDTLLSYGIPLEKMILVAHGQWDLLRGNELSGVSIYDKVHAYAVVSEQLKQKSQEFGISRIPHVTPLGIIVDTFVRPIPKQLSTLGYASSFEHKNFAGADIKRGHLAETVAEKTGLKLVINTKHHYLGMPSFYASVDAVIMTSTEESVGLPMLEAAAAGRLTVGTPVGYYAQNAQPSGGILAPLDEADFITEVTKKLLEYKQRPAEFRKACIKLQAYAKEHYDWSDRIEPWVHLLS